MIIGDQMIEFTALDLEIWMMTGPGNRKYIGK